MTATDHGGGKAATRPATAAADAGRPPAAGGGGRGPSRLAMLCAVAVGAALGAGCLALWKLWPEQLDPRAVSLCRSVIPALNPEGTTYSFGPARRGPGEGALRVAYVAHLPDGRTRARVVGCRFAAGDGGRPRITGVSTERGPLGEANFYFLRRFYLEADDGPPPDPGAAQVKAPAGGNN
ncbi:hypothetical protein ACFFJB_05005 [Camelimonas abortus]|uniref:Lipoprotein n=1 Tax=Camelimonas abortus TaxID=1017184 RepID=A0ABV7LC86_9HYPH